MKFPSPLGDHFFNLTLKGMKSLSTKQDLSFRPHQGDYFFNLFGNKDEFVESTYSGFRPHQEDYFFNKYIMANTT